MARSGEIYREWTDTVILELEDLYPWFDIDRRTALHEAAEFGDLEFVQYLVRRRPRWVTTADSKGVTPLHLAAANGHLEVVRHLILDQNQNQNHLQGGSGTFSFLIKDDEGNTPLHMAADNGHKQVVKLFISKLLPGYLFIKPTSSLQRCVILCGLQTLQQIVDADPNFLNGFDEDGNTLLHTATLLNNLQMVRYLVGRGDVWTGKNKHREKGKHMMENFFENKQNDILLASSIIVFMTCRAGLNPPGGVFQEDKRDPSGDLISPMGTSVMASTNPYMYVMFSIVNTLAFVSSLSIIVLLISGIRIKQTNFMWLTSVGIWFTITSMGYFYFDAAQFITLTRALKFDGNPLFLMRRISMSMWLGLTTIILLVPTNHFTRLPKKIGVLCANGVLKNNAPFISAIFPKPNRHKRETSI
ncbi:hypothetical protein LguiA_005313 [Lonicera macranthoides]